MVPAFMLMMCPACLSLLLSGQLPRRPGVQADAPAVCDWRGDRLPSVPARGRLSRSQAADVEGRLVRDGHDVLLQARLLVGVFVRLGVGSFA